ncbi:hypothetical protein KCP73_00060 [Salmonella enterica subsp. enterica]|nr:hypothetical protein KCP73_00060 [Salmonella enterica subsp. enterica]
MPVEYLTRNSSEIVRARHRFSRCPKLRFGGFLWLFAGVRHKCLIDRRLVSFTAIPSCSSNLNPTLLFLAYSASVRVLQAEKDDAAYNHAINDNKDSYSVFHHLQNNNIKYIYFKMAQCCCS